MDRKTEDKKTVTLISKIGPLVGLLATAITVFSNLNIVIRYIMVVLLVMITVVSIYAVFGQPLIKFVKKKTMAKRHRVLIKKYSKNFDRLVDRFGELINENHCDTIVYILNNLRNNTKYAHILPQTQEFRSAFDVLHEARGKLHITKENFMILVRWFESIVNLCNEYLICKPVEQIRTIGRDGIPEQVREDYERCKAIYDRFMDDYMDFAKDMNKQFGERVAKDYFQVPKGL